MTDTDAPEAEFSDTEWEDQPQSSRPRSSLRQRTSLLSRAQDVLKRRIHLTKMRLRKLQHEASTARAELADNAKRMLRRGLTGDEFKKIRTYALEQRKKPAVVKAMDKVAFMFGVGTLVVAEYIGKAHFPRVTTC